MTKPDLQSMTTYEFVAEARRRTPTARVNTPTGRLLEEALRRLEELAEDNMFNHTQPQGDHQ